MLGFGAVGLLIPLESTDDKGKTLIPKSGPFYEWEQGLCLLKANKAVSMNVYMSVQRRKAFLRVRLERESAQI